jgi:hypothetical protein
MRRARSCRCRLSDERRSIVRYGNTNRGGIRHAAAMPSTRIRESRLVVADSSGTMIGRHLLEVLVSDTPDMSLTEKPTPIHKALDERSGLKLIE